MRNSSLSIARGEIDSRPRRSPIHFNNVLPQLSVPNRMALMASPLPFGSMPSSGGPFACVAVSAKISRAGWRDAARSDHFVQVYDEDEVLVKAVAEYAADGLWQGQRAIVIAAADHVCELKNRLKELSVDVASALVTRQLTLLDADETLGKFMRGDSPDPTLFDAVVGETVRWAGASGRGVRAFGEMVAILWARGNTTGAIEVEKLWNALSEKTKFTLFCGYPSACFCDEQMGKTLADVCAAHSRVIPPESFVAA
jgi:hypothetical protein